MYVIIGLIILCPNNDTRMFVDFGSFDSVLKMLHTHRYYYRTNLCMWKRNERMRMRSWRKDFFGANKKSINRSCWTLRRERRDHVAGMDIFTINLNYYAVWSLTCLVSTDFYRFFAPPTSSNQDYSDFLLDFSSIIRDELIIHRGWTTSHCKIKNIQWEKLTCSW